MKNILQQMAEVNPKALNVIKKQLKYLFSDDKLRVIVRINYDPKDVPFEISSYWGMLIRNNLVKIVDVIDEKHYITEVLVNIPTKQAAELLEKHYHELKEKIAEKKKDVSLSFFSEMGKNKDIIKRLKQNDPSLTVLDFSQENLSPEESLEIFNALKMNTHVSQIKFLDNDSSGKAAIALGELLSVNNTISHLYLGTNQLNNDDIIHITNGLKKNTALTFLDINSNLFDNPEPIAALLKHNTFINEIDLTNSNINNNGFAEIYKSLCENKNSGLTEFNVYFPQISCINDFENFCKENASRLQNKFNNLN